MNILIINILILLSVITTTALNNQINKFNLKKLVSADDHRLDVLIKEVFNIPSVMSTATHLNKLKNNNVVLKRNIECLNGLCVPFHLCVNNTIIHNGEGIISERFSDTPTYCKELEQCCIPKFLKSNSPILVSEIPETNINQKCGVRNMEIITSRITGNNNTAENAEFPWMVAILKKKETNSKQFIFQCGGSLIHPSVVLTAAHCVDSMRVEVLKVRAGDWDTRDTNEPWPHQDRDVSDVIIHEMYYRPALYNDIAVVILTEPVELAVNINTICLPPLNYEFIDGQRCFVAGWGKDNYGKKGKYQAILKKVDLPVVNYDECRSLFQKTILGKFFQLHSSFICAGGEFGKDACKGDGGSPLMCPVPNNRNIYYQAGIVSWGIGCNESKIPGAYVRIANFRKWIDAQLKMRNFNENYYVANLDKPELISDNMRY